ncbi:MAG TPA: sensor histidine kinase [Actinomycetota bacterium]|nr:sensor histidine kinase [Actinomycetota bacterium]
MQFAVAVPTIAVMAVAFSTADFEARWFLWSVLITAIELMPVPAWRGITISVGFPLLIAIAMLYPPSVAVVLTFLGASDPRELRREVSVGLALFNRSQVALAVMAASAVFHALIGEPAGVRLETLDPVVLVGAASVAAIADYIVNGSLVAVYMSTKLRMNPWRVLQHMRAGNLREFLISYLGLGVLGLTLAVLFQEVGPWSLPAFLAPLLFARQVFFRSKALEEAHEELQEREQVLRELSNTMAEERADERLQIAGYLHDDLAQVLFRLSLQVDIAKKLLDKRDLAELQAQLSKIKDSKQETSNRIRALIRDLHRSPLGAKGLAEAIESLIDEVGKDSDVAFHLDVEDIDLPAPIALLLYHIGREGVMNALKHADASDVWLSVLEEREHIVLRLRDNGRGFDASVPGPEGHYGMSMMRGRARVGGGTFQVESSPGRGTLVIVQFPVDLLQRDLPDSETPNANGQGRAFPGTTEPT